MSCRRTASLSALRLRADLLARTRDFFAQRDVLEVETPALSPAGNTDPSLTCIVAKLEGLDEPDHYLHTSPEYAMKRLLAAGYGDIYQICRVFRDGELGRWHQPEFTMLEWYRVGWTDRELANEVEALCRHLLADVDAVDDVVRMSYGHAFENTLGIDPHAAHGEIGKVLRDCGIDTPAGLDADALLDLALSTVVVPSFNERTLVILHDYPASQAALARIKPSTPPVAARFEAFLAGVELANGFHELNDAAEQLERFNAENRRRIENGKKAAPIDRDFIAALEAGLPECAGVAVGFDRVVALANGSDNVADVMAFAHGCSEPIVS